MTTTTIHSRAAKTAALIQQAEWQQDLLEKVSDFLEVALSEAREEWEEELIARLTKDADTLLQPLLNSHDLITRVEEITERHFVYQLEELAEHVAQLKVDVARLSRATNQLQPTGT